MTYLDESLWRIQQEIIWDEVVNDLAVDAVLNSRCTETQRGSCDLTYCRWGDSSQKHTGKVCFPTVTQETCGDQDAIYYLQKQDSYQPNNPSVEKQDRFTTKSSSSSWTLQIFFFVVRTETTTELRWDERNTTTSCRLKILFILMSRF